MIPILHDGKPGPSTSDSELLTGQVGTFLPQLIFSRETWLARRRG